MDRTTETRATEVTLFLCGDVMTGRGVDQVMPRSCPPRLYEPGVASALEYVDLAERQNGPIPRGVEPTYVWGDALPTLRRIPDARIINLETAVTTSEAAEPKGINYRMHPDNVAVLAAAGIDCCVLANNHVLDWGTAGLLDTLDAVTGAGIATAGAGRDVAHALAPAVLPLRSGARVLVFALGAMDSGIPPGWAAGPDRPGIAFLPAFPDHAVRAIADAVGAARRPGDLVVLSIHWGENWGYEIPAAHQRFARALVERAGVDIVYGHSSHHPKAIDVHDDRLILYGCGDFLDDYEGIAGYEPYRDDLVLAYFPTLDAATRRLVRLEMLPFQIRNFRLRTPSRADRAWLLDTLDRECRRLGRAVVERGEAFVLE